MDNESNCSLELQQALLDLKNSTINIGSKLSPQLKRKLDALVGRTFDPFDSRSLEELHHKIGSILQRLILELIQMHESTINREKRLVNLVNQKGCSIRFPEITERVVESIIKLYTAPGQPENTAYERKVLTRFVMNEVNVFDCPKSQYEKMINTFYWASCFDVIPGQGAPARLKLKEEYYDPLRLRERHDLQMMRLARDNFIYLSAESWAHLLRGRSTPEDVAQMQSLLDKYPDELNVEKLQKTVMINGDRYNLATIIDSLNEADGLMNRQPWTVGVAIDLIKIFVERADIFSFRQSRNHLRIESIGSYN